MNSAVKLVEVDYRQRPVKAAQGRSTQSLWHLLRTWYQRARGRRHLMTLPPSALKDIGISRTDAVHEGSKPFWRR